MTESLAQLLRDLESKDDGVRKAAFDELLAQAEQPVDWFDDAFDALADKLGSGNSFQRNIGVMLLSGLAKSDSAGRLASVADRCLALLEDEKFITTRMAAQSVWKIGAAQPALRPRIVDGLMRALDRSRMNAHPNLIRQDIVAGLMRIHAAAPESVDLEQIRAYIASNCETAEKKRLLLLLP
jgi:hypothetical protein